MTVTDTTRGLKLLLDAKEAAEALGGICPKTLWSLTKKGVIPHLRLGRRVLYDPRALERWIEQQQQGGRA